MRYLWFCIALIALYPLSPTLSQSEQPEGKNLDDQFREMRDKAETYNEYRVIKGSQLNTLWKSVQDTLQAYRSGLENRAAVTNELNVKLQELQSRLSNTEQLLDAAVDRENTIAFLGREVRKGFYNLIMWILVFLLGATAVAMSVRSHRHGNEAREAVDNLHQLETEFEELRRKSQEKQARLARELQTERNRVAELSERIERGTSL